LTKAMNEAFDFVETFLISCREGARLCGTENLDRKPAAGQPLALS
jgi:hypothetical protein